VRWGSGGRPPVRVGRIIEAIEGWNRIGWRAGVATAEERPTYWLLVAYVEDPDCGPGRPPEELKQVSNAVGNRPGPPFALHHLL
jgi:hypothetical protein